MVIGTPDNSYEDEMHHALGIPMVADPSQKKEPLKLTITPHMNAGEDQQDTRMAGLKGIDTEGKEDEFDYINPYKAGSPESQQWHDKLYPSQKEELQDWYEIKGLQGGGVGYKTKRQNTKPPEVGQLDEPKNVHIVRHGETTENADNTVRGWEPVSLNERGRQEAEKAADELKSKGVDTLVASDLQRSKETAEIIGKKLGIVPQYDPRLRTWNVGEHAGKPCSTSNPVLKEYAQNKQDEPVPGGESFNDFKGRSFAGIRDAILNNKDKNLAILTHNRVEATLKGWEKTGQDNPDIDYNEVVKEETEPGTVRTVQFQPDATILKPSSFDDRYGGWWKPGLPLNAGETEGRGDTGKEPLGWWKHGLPPRKLQQTFDAYDPRFEQPKFQTLPFNPEDRDNTYSPISDKTIEDLAKKHQIEGSKLKEILRDVKPEDIIGTGELGMARVAKGVVKGLFDKAIKEGLESGKSISNIAKELGISRAAIRWQMENLGLNKYGKEDLPDWFKEEMEQTLEKEKAFVEDLQRRIHEYKINTMRAEGKTIREDDYLKMLQGKLKPSK